MPAGRRLVFITAGEPSGDLLGGRLMAALRARSEDRIEFAGVGGKMMIEQGLDPLFPMEDLSVMGLAEILPRIPLLLRRIRQTAEAATRLDPAALVTIDSPDFSFRVASRVSGGGFPCIHYVAPTVWAWRPERAAKIAKFLDLLLALLPFEPPYFEKVGLACRFVGHPALEGGAGRGNGQRFRARHGIPAERRVVVMLPGSRAGEIGRLLPIFAAALRLLAAGRQPFAIAVPVPSHHAERVRGGLAAAGLDAQVIEGEQGRFDAFAAADVALAKSGTVTLELALAGVPSVIAYRINPLTYAIVAPRTTVRFVGLPNIILDRPLMPELLQGECRPDLLAAALARLLDDGDARTAQIAGMRDVRSRLTVPGTTPSEAAANAVLGAIDQRRSIGT